MQVFLQISRLMAFIVYNSTKYYFAVHVVRNVEKGLIILEEKRTKYLDKSSVTGFGLFQDVM